MTLTELLHQKAWRPAVDQAITLVEADRTLLTELLGFLRHESAQVVMRGSMAVADLGRAHPEWLRPHHRELIALLRRDPIDATNRCLFRYFAELPLDDIDPAIVYLDRMRSMLFGKDGA